MIAVDVRSKALFAYFGVTIHETRPFTPGGPEVNPSTFRVKIPFLQLAQLWEVHDPESHEMSLIVILDSPPVYHRQSTGILATFNTQSSWRDTDLWLRQTCIAHNLGLRTRPKSVCAGQVRLLILVCYIFKTTLSSSLIIDIPYSSQADGMFSSLHSPLETSWSKITSSS